MKLRHSARSDVGRTRDHNEDDFGIGEGAQIDELGNLFVLCDGMGGYAAGEVASRIGVETILSSFYNNSSDDRSAVLKLALERANDRIHEEGRGNMGTTGVCALLHHDALVVANVGDSRAYLIRNTTIRQISHDHSLVGEQVAAGLISAKDARSINYRNVITRALGHQAQVDVDLFRMPLQKGDIVALTSDGLHGLVEDDEIKTILAGQPLEQAVERLVDLANERGGTDNITIVAVVVDSLDWASAPVEDELPTQPAAATQEIAATAALPAAEMPASPPIQAASAPATERRLTTLGGLLALLLLVILVFAILFALRTTPEQAQPPGVIATSAPTTGTGPTLTPALATAVPGATVSPASTAPASTVPAGTPATNITPTAGSAAPSATPRP